MPKTSAKRQPAKQPTRAKKYFQVARPTRKPQTNMDSFSQSQRKMIKLLCQNPDRQIALVSLVGCSGTDVAQTIETAEALGQRKVVSISPQALAKLKALHAASVAIDPAEKAVFKAVMLRLRTDKPVELQAVKRGVLAEPGRFATSPVRLDERKLSAVGGCQPR